MSAEVFFDYTCGFSNRVRLWLDALADVALVWRPFSLLERNARDGETPVFELAEYSDNPSLIALAVHEQLRAQDGDLDGYRRRMFTAWHEQPGRLSTEDMIGFGRDAGLQEFDRTAGYAAVGAHHTEAVKLGVFGTPTLVLAPEQIMFLELDSAPPADRVQPLWEAVTHLADSGQDLREWRRVTPPTETE